jgi:hypothetical protein
MVGTIALFISGVRPMAFNNQRRRLLVDPGMQFRLVGRMGIYFLIYAVGVVHIAFVFELLARFAVATPSAWQKGLGGMYLEFLAGHRALFLSLILFVPPLLYDLFKFSNRIAGPLFRCRRMMDEMAEGKQVPEFKPREGDLMGELFESFNRLIIACNKKNVLHAEEQAPQARPENPGPEAAAHVNAVTPSRKIGV